MKLTANRYHDISCGHRVVGHEGKCRFLHGHNYRVHFYCAANDLDEIGRVVDFSVIKEALCMWLENNWDHKFLYWDSDPLISFLEGEVVKENNIDRDKNGKLNYQDSSDFLNSLVCLPFNPTAENMADYLLNTVGPIVLRGTGVSLIKVTIEETRKCSVTGEIE